MQVSPEVLIQTLSNALSQECEIFKVAEQHLNEWQTQPGFYVDIVKILANHSIDTNIRWISAVILKQGVERYWSTSKKYYLSSIDKEVIRNELFAVLTEPAHHVAVKMATIIAQIAHYDYSNHWLNLISKIMNTFYKNIDYLHNEFVYAIEVNSALNRGILVLKHVIKQLATKRYPNGRLHFSNITYNIYPDIVHIWKATTEKFFNNPQSCHLDIAINALKILEELCASGFTLKQLKENEVDVVILLMLEYFDRILKLRNKETVNQSLKTIIEKYANRVIKLYIKLQRIHRIYFLVELLEKCFQILIYYSFSSEAKILTYDKLRNLLITMIENILDESGTTKMRLIDFPKNYQFFLDNFMSNDCHLYEIVQSLINDYMKLTEEDLNLWHNNPEDFLTQEINNNNNYNNRVIAVSILSRLMTKYDAQFRFQCKDLFKSIMVPSVNITLDSILLKEAIYRIFEIVDKDQCSDTDFDEWVTKVLVIEMSNKEPCLRILQRRLIYVMTAWFTRSDTTLKSTLYDVYLYYLDESNDLVIRFTVAICLETFLKYEYEPMLFVSYWEKILFKLFSLIQVIRDCELKIRILEVMVNIVDVYQNSSTLFLSNFDETLIPMLWEESKDHNLLRCNIVVILSKITNSLGSKSDLLYKYTLPVIELGINLNNPDSIYLLEYSLELWLIVLQNTKIDHIKQLTNFCPYLPLVLDQSTESLGYCLRICTEYILIIPDDYLQNYGLEFMNCCSKILPEISNENFQFFSKIFNAAFVLSPILASQCTKIIIPTLLKLIITKKTNVFEIKFSFIIIGRMLMSSVELFNESLLDYLKIENETTFDTLLDLIITEWIHTFRGYCTTEENKIFVMAGCCLLKIRSNSISNHFSEILRTILDTLKYIVYQISGGEDDPLTNSVGNDNLSIDSLNSLFKTKASINTSTEEIKVPSIVIEMENESQHENRLAHLRSQDPIYNIDIRHYVRTKFFEIRHQYSQKELDSFLLPICNEYQILIQRYFYGVKSHP